MVNTAIVLSNHETTNNINIIWTHIKYTAKIYLSETVGAANDFAAAIIAASSQVLIQNSSIFQGLTRVC